MVPLVVSNLQDLIRVLRDYVIGWYLWLTSVSTANASDLICL